MPATQAKPKAPRAVRGDQPGHRDRLIAAMAESVEARGYRETFVSDVVRIARTSRRSFYEHFEDREACYLALFDAANQALTQEIASAVEPDQPWEEQVDAALAAYLDAIAARPALWQSFVRELPALGESGGARQQAAIERVARLMVGLIEESRRAQPGLGAKALSVDMAIIVVGGLRELSIIAADQGRDVRDLRPIAARTVKAILSALIES